MEHGDQFPCPTCGNPETRLDTETPAGEELPPGEWAWFSEHFKRWECAECWLK